MPRTTPIEIVFLAEHPEHLPAVAMWIYDEWEQYRPGASPHETEASFRERLQRDAIPLTLIALRAGTLVGTASIFVSDMQTHLDLGPWLAGVYVQAQERGSGIGSLLVQAIMMQASRLGIPQLYLFTPDQEHFYARLGWHTIEHAFYDDHPVVIMMTELESGAGTD